jgi:hypothetical protein
MKTSHHLSVTSEKADNFSGIIISCTYITGNNFLKFFKQAIRKSITFLIVPFLFSFGFLQQGLSQVKQTITTSGTFTVPVGVTSITVECWGGGGRGSTLSSNMSGAGGGGGAYAKSVISVSPNTGYPIVVGSGSSTTSSGGDSYFGTGSDVLAKGGNSSPDNSNTSVTGQSGSIGNIITYNGGNSALGSGNGGGGGSSGGTGSDGNYTNTTTTSSTGGTITGGGSGGSGRTGSSGNGSSGSVPGGGGGGAFKSSGTTTRNGGNGANGQVVVSYMCPTYELTSPASATSICGSSGTSTVTLTSATLPAGTYNVTYSTTNPTSTDTKSMNFTGPTGTFTTKSLSATSVITVTSISLAINGCPFTPGSNNSATVTVTALPGQPSTITGATSPNQGTTQTYSVTNVTGVTYAWAFPSDWVQNPVSNTSSVTVVVGAASGNITVTPSTCGAGTAKTLAVTPIPLPANVTITPTSATICEGGSVNMTGSATMSSGIIAVGSDDFNGTPTYIYAGTPGLGGEIFTQQASGSTVGLTTITNNVDASSFMIATSIATLTTASTLTSPSINTTGLTALNLTFIQAFKPVSTSTTASVEVSINGGSWTSVKSYTGNQGANNNFVSDNIDLAAYLNQSDLKIRFNTSLVSTLLSAAWWAIDNVTLNGVPLPLFSWSADTPSPSNGLQSGTETPSNANKNITVTPTATTKYTLTAKNTLTNLTANSSEATVVVNQLPQGSLTGNSICTDGTGQFTFTSTSGEGPFTLVISGVSYPSVVSGTPFNANPNPSATTTYTLTSITDANSCPRTSDITGASATITVSPYVTPAVSITADPSGPICSGVSVTFTAKPKNEGSNPSYQWKLNGLNVGSNSSIYTPITLSNGDQISCELTSNALCASPLTASDVISMTVNPSPEIFIVSGGGTYCSADDGVSITLSGSETGVDYYLYKDNGATLVASLPGTGNSLSFNNVMDAGTYTIVGKNAITPCTTSMTGSAIVKMYQTPTIEASSGPTCIGSELDLFSTTTNGTLDDKYSWTGPGGFTSIYQNPIIAAEDVSTANGGLYSVTITRNECPSSPAQVNVVINPAPEFTISSDVTLCEGKDLTLNATGGDTYSWTGPDGIVILNPDMATASVPNIPTTGAGLYSVALHNNLCDINGIRSTTVTINPMPKAPDGADYTGIYNGSQFTATATVSEQDVIVEWFTDATGNTTTIQPTAIIPGTYTAYAQASNTVTGCINPTRTLVTLVIDKRPISITVDADQGKSCEQPDPPLTFKVTSGSLAPGESFIGSLHREDGTLAGSYLIDIGTLSIVRGADNTLAYYNLTPLSPVFFTITDKIMPVITAHNNITATADLNLCTAVLAIDPATATDNCVVGDPIGTRDDHLSLNEPYPVGITTITWNVTDSNGNPAEPKLQTVTVSDEQPPVITKPADVNKTADIGKCYATIVITAPEATDNCGVGKPVGTRNDGMAMNDTYPVGTIVITWNVDDIHGNHAEAVTQNVIVTDNEKPLITPSENIIKDADASSCSASVLVPAATATDNCGVGSPAGTRDDGKALTDPYPVGLTTITWKVTDIHGNDAVDAIQTVTVQDHVPPTVITKPVTLQIPAGGTLTVLPSDVDAGSSDPCGIKSITVSPNTFVCGEVGDHTVTLTVTDNNNNSATGTAVVTVQDNLVQAKAKNISIELDDNGNASITAAMIDNGSSGACGISSLEVSPSTFDCSKTGPNTVTLTVTNNHGVSSTATATVTVLDNIKPTVNVQDFTLTLDATGNTRMLLPADLDNQSIDNCGIISFGLSKNTFNCSNIGKNDVFLFATDKSMNSNVARATVTVVDNIAPVITCPGNITQTADAGKCGANVNFEATATDNCSAVITYSQNPGTFFTVGTTDVTATAIDPGGNKSSCTFQVTVTDNELPVITAKVDILQTADLNKCSAAVTIDPATATDNCGVGAPAGTRSDGLALSDPYPVGTTTITWNVTDIHSNAAIAVTQKVKITDDELPVLTAPANILVNNDKGVCGALVTVETATATDNCGLGTITGTRNDGKLLTDLYPVGTTTITWNVTDIHGNNAVAVFSTVTVTDTEIPVLTAPAAVNENNDKGLCSAIINIKPATATDNCSLGIILGTRDDGKQLSDPFPVGTTTITWTVSDVNGNPAIPVDQLVVVTDNELPVITAKVDILQTADLNKCSAVVTIDPATATDNCGVGAPAGTRSDGLDLSDPYPVGTTTITWNVTDIHSNAAIAVTQKVTITDDELPVLTAPANIPVNNDKGVCGALVTVETATASDNCGLGTITGTRNDGKLLTDLYPVGTTTITWNVTDIHGNNAVAVFSTVTVTDTEIPVLTAPAAVNENNDKGLCSAIINIKPATATDNCSLGIILGTRDDGKQLSDPFPVGTTTITWTVSDVNGNPAIPVDQLVIVTDNELPVITAKADILQTADLNKCSAVVTIDPATATDNCGVGAPAGKRGDGLALTDPYPVGTTTITWNVTDIHSNAAIAVTQKVTITDDELPVLTSPANISVNNDKGVCGALVTVESATATDNCGLGTITGTRNDGKLLTDLYPVGPTTITWNVTDIHGNKATPVTSKVEVTDNELPVITTNGDRNVNTDPDVCGATVVVSATAKDNCSVDTPTGIRSDGKLLNALFSVGTTTIKWNVIDANGNPAAEVIQTVIVTDNQKPVIKTNGNQNVTNSPGECGANMVQVSATASDNCSVGTPTGNRSDGKALSAMYPIGTTTIKWNVKDDNNNVADEVVQTVIVTDVQAPEITCPANISVNNDPGKCGAIVPFTVTATDNCSAVLTYSQNPGTLFPVGTTSVTSTATDPSGNKSTCTFTITVKDNEIPVITANGDKVVNTDLNVCGATVNVSATATDNCNVPVPTGIRSDGLALNALYPVGITTIKWNVNDANGNPAAEVIQKVTVADNQLPTVIVRNITIQLDATGNATITPADINNGSSDACGIQSMVLSKTTFTSADVLTSPNMVTLTVTDIHGNVASATASVTVASIKITVKANTETKVYGDLDPELTYTFTPALLSGDSFSGNLTRDPGVKAGIYAINQGSLALKGYYTIIYQGANLTITARPVTVTADPVSKEFGSADPAFTYKITSGNLIAPDAFTGALTCTHTEQPGTYPILQGTLALSTNYLITYIGADFTIKPKTVGPAVTVSPGVVQYSDQVTFTATITMGAPLLSGRLHPLAFVTFKIGLQEMGTVQLKVNGLDLVGKLTVPLLEKVKGQLAPGNKTVYAVFSFPDSKIKVSPNPVTTDLTITPEDARVNMTGLFIESTSEDYHKFGNDEDNRICMKATVQDISAVRFDQDYDPYQGDIRNARVRFMKGSTAISPWLTPDLVNGRDSKTGTVNFKWVYDNGSKNLPNDISIEIGGNGYYVRNNPADMSVVTLYSPTGNYVVGGGYLMNPFNTGGTYAGTPGLSTNFGFVVKFQDKGKTPNGNIHMLIRKADDDGIHTYLVESTSITSVGVTNHTHHSTISSVVAKANLTDITDISAPVILGSNLKLQLNLTDNSESNSNDLIGMTLWNGGTLLFSSSWTGNSTAQRMISGGKIIIHSGYSFGDIFNATDNNSNEFMVTPELGVKAYPNPFTDHVYFDLQLNTDSKVRLEIFDVTGAKISTVFDDVVIAYNRYQLEYAPENFSSNMLMYKLVVDGKIVFTGKLIHK